MNDTMGGPTMLIVDVEADWAGTEIRAIGEVLPVLVDLLDRANASATFFVVADLVDAVRPFLAPSGKHEVGSHSLTHARLRHADPNVVRTEVAVSKARLEAAGYVVSGFRSPFGSTAPTLLTELAHAGYRYDASRGPALPFGRGRGPAVVESDHGVAQLTTGVLRDRITPAAMTWMRIASPWSRWWLPRTARSLSCHLHDFLPDSHGWAALPTPLRAFHRRGAGAPAWDLLEYVLTRPDTHFVTCSAYLDGTELGNPCTSL